MGGGGQWGGGSGRGEMETTVLEQQLKKRKEKILPKQINKKTPV